MVTAQYLACLCDIAACLSGSQEVAELAHCTDNIAQVCNATLRSASHLVSGLSWCVIVAWPDLHTAGCASTLKGAAGVLVGLDFLRH